MRRVFGKHLIRGPDQDARVLAKLRASFDRVSVLLDSVEPIEGPPLAQSGRSRAA
jgi:D-serine deaminase-like pyridoxal phosphate-dependent protein